MGKFAELTQLFRSKFFWAFLIVLTGGAAFSVFFWSRSASAPELIRASKGSIVETVSATGKTKPSQSVDLAFVRSGRVSRVDVRVGDRVARGALLAGLDSSELSADLRVAEAGAEAARAKLSELEAGTRLEEIKIQEAKVDAARESLADAEQGLRDRIQESYTKADDAIRTKTDPLFSNPRYGSPRLNYAVGDQVLENRLERERGAMELALAQWKTSIGAGGDLKARGAEAASNLSKVSGFLDDASLFANALSVSSSLSQATINAYRSDISTGRTNVSSSAVNLSAAVEKYRSAASDVELEERELLLDRAGSTKEEIDAQKAAVDQATANVSKIQAELSQTALRAPFSGIITRQDADVGETVAQNSALVSIQAENGLEIESNIPEVDIGRIKTGNSVEITVDAFSGEKFHGAVVHIDPAETVIDGAVNFKIRVSFQNPDPRLKSGLTANLSIETVRRDGALILPALGIIENDQGSFARRVRGGQTVQVPITTGIRSQDGMVEIVSGLAEGDEVENIGLKK